MSVAHLAAVPPSTDRLLTSREVAGRLAVSVSMVRKLVALGQLRAIRVGRLPRFEAAGVDEYIARQRGQGARR